MSNVDWSKAPEGFPIWVEDLNRDQDFDQSGWHADCGDRYVDQSGSYWLKSNYYAFRVHERPATPQWNGEGLPPVGANVEYKGFKDQWKQGSYLGQFRGQIVIGCHESGVVGICESAEIRPIRTPEQIAAEEREKAIGEMLAAAGVTGSAFSDDLEAIAWAAALYDAGYRKKGQPE